MSNLQEPETYTFAPPEGSLDHDAVKVVDRLRRHGHETYLVGGCIRDLLAGIVPKDFDVATAATPHQVKKLFRNCWLIGRRFRLAHVVFSQQKKRKIIEVATFRAKPFTLRGISLYGGKPARDLLVREDNVFGTPYEDAHRRDFTVNALFFDHSNNTVFDYVGGYRDIERGLIRSIGDPLLRFREDPVRMIRACRYSAKLGFTLEQRVCKAMGELSDEILKASPSRLLEELFKTLESGASEESFRLMLEHGLLKSLSRSLSRFLEQEQRARPGTMDKPRGWSHLKALDVHVAKFGKEALSRPVYLSLLAVPMARPVADKIKTVRECSARAAMKQGVDMVLSALMVNFRIPKRDVERVRQVAVAQERMAPSTNGARPCPPSRLLGRDYFLDALSFLYLDSVATGETWNQYAWWYSLNDRAKRLLPPPPPWVKVEEAGRRTDTPGKRRKRRRKAGNVRPKTGVAGTQKRRGPARMK